jgi:hypothetical protein
VNESACPRCDGQRYDVGSCALCDNIGLLNSNGDRLDPKPVLPHRTRCPECEGRGGSAYTRHLQICGTMEDEPCGHRPEWSVCRLCHGDGSVASLPLAIYRARGGLPPVPFRGYS